MLRILPFLRGHRRLPLFRGARRRLNRLDHRDLLHEIRDHLHVHFCRFQYYYFLQTVWTAWTSDPSLCSVSFCSTTAPPLSMINPPLHPLGPRRVQTSFPFVVPLQVSCSFPQEWMTISSAKTIPPSCRTRRIVARCRRWSTTTVTCKLFAWRCPPTWTETSSRPPRKFAISALATPTLSTSSWMSWLLSFTLTAAWTQWTSRTTWKTPWSRYGTVASECPVDWLICCMECKISGSDWC